MNFRYNLKKTTQMKLITIMLSLLFFQSFLLDTLYAEDVPVNWEESVHLKYLNIGFASGYLRDTHYYKKALQQISVDGFKYVRVFELFSKKDINGHRSIFKDLKYLSDQGINLMLSLSNYPYRLLPPKRYNKYSKNRLRYTNRFPPANIEEYGAYLKKIFQEMEDLFGRNKIGQWYFEIGNEPDAPLFFWGLQEEFEKIFNTSVGAIKAINPNFKVGGAGFTSRLLLDNAKAEYLNFAKYIKLYNQVDFLSFHIYSSDFSNNVLQSKELIRELTANNKINIISEWNISTKADRSTYNILKSKYFMTYLVDMLTVCYNSDINFLYIHKLMDHPKKAKYQLGIFNKEGAPKQAYEYIKHVREIVESGYKVYDSKHIIIIKGNSKLIAMSKDQNNIFNYSGYTLLDSSFSVNLEGQQLPKGEWVVLGF